MHDKHSKLPGSLFFFFIKVSARFGARSLQGFLPQHLVQNHFVPSTFPLLAKTNRPPTHTHIHNYPSELPRRSG